MEILDNTLGVFTNSPAFSWLTTNLNNYLNLHTGAVRLVDWNNVKLRQISLGPIYSACPVYLSFVAIRTGSLSVKHGSSAERNS